MANFLFSALGAFVHPWLNTPDTKYNVDGLFHTDLDCSGPEAEAVAAKIEAACVAYRAEYTQEMKPGEAKKWSAYLPFERLEDDNGEPTGVIRFTFKQNAKIKSAKEPSGFKSVKIELRDSQNQIIDVPVWSGSEGRVMFSMRGIETQSSKTAGMRLDLAKAQITKLKKGGGSSQGFGKVEGGYEADEAAASFADQPQDNQPDETGGDY
ncbi:hypothetical protein [Mesorhizobium sp. M0767]|uniref:hypothetical protein n=1 Tax=Mesorhizobium sp. M0767 TaxID=2956995 RepID=UPI00333909F1